jgi:uncharacterized protein
MPNPVTHFQILSPAPDEHAAFYRSLFGWSIDAANPLGYRQLDTGTERGIQGGIWPAPPQASAFVQLFVEVEDLDASVQKAVELGSKAIIPPQTLPQGDRMAVLMDPHGLTFALTQPQKS